MVTYVTLCNFTDQGMRAVKETVNRAAAFGKAASDAGHTVKDIYWLHGQYDILAITESPDEIAATALSLTLAKQGNIRLQTLRALTAAEMEKVLEKVA